MLLVLLVDCIDGCNIFCFVFFFVYWWMIRLFIALVVVVTSGLPMLESLIPCVDGIVVYL